MVLLTNGATVNTFSNDIQLVQNVQMPKIKGIQNAETFQNNFVSKTDDVLIKHIKDDMEY